MIRLNETLLLASTKLKTRRIRLGITIIISALLFAVLVFISIVTDGAIKSLKDFSQEGYGGRYLVQATPVTYSGFGEDEKLVAELSPVHRDLIAKKKKIAKQLDVPYEESGDAFLPLSVNKGPDGKSYTYPNHGSPIVRDLLAERDKAIPGTSYEDFNRTAKTAGAKNTYQGSGAMAGARQLAVLVNGKENYSQHEDVNSAPPALSGAQTITTLGWGDSEEPLLLPFILPGQTLATGKDGSIPVIAPFSAAEEILGLKALPATATAAERLERLQTVRKTITGKAVQLCYRNSASTNLLSGALQQQKEIEANKKNKDYAMPSLLYQLPSAACTATTIKSDKRTSEEKKQAANQKAFDLQFGHTTEPEQGTLNIRIVGLSPDISSSANIDAGSILTGLFSSSLGGGWVSPTKAIAANPLAVKALKSNVPTAYPGMGTNTNVYYAEFTTLTAMEKFIKDQTCSNLMSSFVPSDAPPGAMAGPPPSSDTVLNCAKDGTSFGVVPYGNSAGAIEDFRKGIWSVSRFALVAILIIASIIMMGNVGKIIADSRRETAVFRALGAKRFDIAQIYITYALLISLLVAVLAGVLGAIAAHILSQHFAPNLTVSALITYNAQDLSREFSLFGLNALYLTAIGGLVLLAGFISASIPLLTNMRRNPIRDMRDES